MPELPDLEVYRKNLTKKVVGKKVDAVLVYNPRKLTLSGEADIDVLASDTIAAIERNGKELFFRFGKGHHIGVHLMLNGFFSIGTDIAQVPYKLFALEMHPFYLVISDPKGLANVSLDKPLPSVPDALSDQFSLDYLKAVLRKKRSKNIKAILIDQAIVRGIGNAYADEILWAAKISPESQAGKIPEQAVAHLFQTIESVLKRSISEIIAIAPDAISGEVRDFMRVHHKNKKTCPNGLPIQHKKIASKTTYFTAEQVVYG
ncbi:MAG: hypothetical protein VR64_09905 [Desulfatitalea sp. BRH_c12]|nr:MAG: hypothetical protein VR64_09905 [Desulfatitalea sp. BRH_c12]